MVNLEIRYMTDDNFEIGKFFNFNEDHNNWTVGTDEGLEWDEVSKMILQQLSKPFTRIIAFAEDGIFHIGTQKEAGGVFYTVSGFNAFTGKIGRAVINHDTVEAIIMLCFGGEEIEGASAYYTLAEQALADWLAEARMTP